MNRRPWLILLGFLPLSLIAVAKPKSLPEIFKNAQFVRVEAYNGDTFNIDVFPADRRAIFAVEQQLKDWHRYGVALERDRADLVLLVRKGRIAGATGRAGIAIGAPSRSHGQPQPDPARGDPPEGVGVSAEAGPADDILEVYVPEASGHLTGPIWTHMLKDGLDAPEVPLFQQLKHAVDTAYPQ